MTDQKPCLPECRPAFGARGDIHAPACPNAPKPPEAPKVETVTAGPPVTMLTESAEDRFLRIMEPIIADAESRMTPQEIEEANAKIAALVESHSPAPAPVAPKECLDRCRWNIDPQGRDFFFHAPSCPNNPGACEDPLCDLMRDHATPHRLRKPAPAPEPQGSEEPIEPVTELEAEKSTSKILRAQLVQAISERDEARATKDMHKERQEEAWAEVAALRAELAQARDERDRVRAEGSRPHGGGRCHSRNHRRLREIGIE